MIDQDQKDTIKLLIGAVKAIQDKEIDSEEAVILCQLSANLLEKIIPLVSQHRLSWVFRASIYGARSALFEAAAFFENMNNETSED